MKILAIGDIHGKNIWEELKYLIDEYDKFIFIGDYFDSFDIKPIIQLHNFNNIIEFKIKYFDKVDLLIGNHDYHYFPTVDENYSGYQSVMRFDFQNSLYSAYNDNMLSICKIYNNYLFSHAGLTKTWLQYNNIDTNNLETSINELFYYFPKQFGFLMGRNFSEYGDDVTQGPLWVRPNSLMKDGISDYVQIVGHTSKQNINRYTQKIIIIDCLDYKKQYLSIDLNSKKPKIIDF